MDDKANNYMIILRFSLYFLKIIFDNFLFYLIIFKDLMTSELVKYINIVSYVISINNYFWDL